MVLLDAQLLIDTRRLMNTMNSERITEMMLAYERAVDLHNHQHTGHETYKSRPEQNLRAYVLDCRLIELNHRSAAALRHANALLDNSRHLHAKSAELAILACTIMERLTLEWIDAADFHTQLEASLSDNIDEVSDKEYEHCQQTIQAAQQHADHLRKDLDLHLRTHGCRRSGERQ